MPASTESVEQWSRFELALPGPAAGNPYVEVECGARFRHKHREVQVDGFYDGDGLYRVRFMPDVAGEWSYESWSNRAELAGHKGAFTCTEPGPGVHGPVRVRDGYHFAYADGAPYFPFGTTCYAWIHQAPELQAETLHTLAAAPYNKMRMCVFPKDYAYNRDEPLLHPFEPAPGGGRDFARPNPAFFRHLDRRVGDLLELGIEADIILFHPYDRWGYAAMGREADDRYLRYVVARLAAFRNVWWSLANEYDIMPAKTMADWDRLFVLVQENDPFQHLRSVHNWHSVTHPLDTFYDYAKPWVTHASIQHTNLRRVSAWRELYRRPVVVDECGYEGNIPHGWGNWSPREMVHRVWVGVASGGYVGHGETYLHPEDILWWSKGGTLHGQSAPRIAFLRRLLEDNVQRGLEPLNDYASYSGREGERYFLFYYGEHQPAEWLYRFSVGHRYRIEIVDPWEMTVTPVEGLYADQVRLALPGRPYLALQAHEVAA